MHTLGIVPTSLVAGRVGSQYVATFSATKGVAPYQWALVHGSLPGGLRLSIGHITGTPTKAGSFNITITGTDSDTPRSSGLEIYTLVVNLEFLPKSLPDPTLGVAYRDALSASGGRAPYRWKVVSGRFPSGLKLTTSGTLSGTPTRLGASTFTVEVTDASTPRLSATKSFTIDTKRR